MERAAIKPENAERCVRLFASNEIAAACGYAGRGRYGSLAKEPDEVVMAPAGRRASSGQSVLTMRSASSRVNARRVSVVTLPCRVTATRI